MPALTNIADHSVLWFVVAGALGAFGGRRGRRAALRGLLAIALASFTSSGVLKRLIPRNRPGPDAFPFVGPRRRPTSSSMPSGHSASAAAFATAAALEFPELAAPLAGLAGAVGYSRVYNGVHYPGDVLFGSAIGVGVAAATTKMWPLSDFSPAAARPVLTRLDDGTRARPDGSGLTIVVNPAAHSGKGGDPADELRSGLPEARVVSLDDAAGLEAALRDAAARGDAIGVVGGDGSINTAVAVALEFDCPLVVVPGGTLNHFARDIGIDSIADAVGAVQRGEVVAIDVGTIDGRPFVNTASFGSYPKLVARRESLEDRIGKWPALVVALVRVLRDGPPSDVSIDGEDCHVSMIFIGNCAYDPPGFAPATRDRLDDGRFDVRIIDGSVPWARSRAVVAALTGTLERSGVYSRRLVSSLAVENRDDDSSLAADGEVFDGHARFTVEKHAQRLKLYAPIATDT